MNNISKIRRKVGQTYNLIILPLYKGEKKNIKIVLQENHLNTELQEF